MTTITIQQIKHCVQSEGSHFFDKDTLRFFGETMKSFGVKEIDNKVYVYRKINQLKTSSFLSKIDSSSKKCVWEFIENDLIDIKNTSPLYAKFYR